MTGSGVFNSLFLMATTDINDATGDVVQFDNFSRCSAGGVCWALIRHSGDVVIPVFIR